MSKYKFKMFCVFHREFFLRDDNKEFIFFGVNEAYRKNNEKRDNVIYEYELEIYNPFLQKRGYMETSAYLHVYWNKLYKNNDMVGFSQYDMIHYSKYDNLDIDTIYLLPIGRYIVENGIWSYFMFSDILNINFFIESYNKFFGKTYTIRELEGIPLSLLQTNIYPVKIYEKLCSWLEILVEEIYPWSNVPPYQTHFGTIGGYTERALSIFNAFQIYEGCKYNFLNIKHDRIDYGCDNQYNEKLFLNNYSQEVHAKYIDNVTGKYDINNNNYNMFKAICYLDGITYSCERIGKKNGTIGLYFKRDDQCNYREEGFDINAKDPRIFIFNDTVYVVFICSSPYENQQCCIGITPFNEWKPTFLQVENMVKNNIEKNWAPFVKDNELYFVYNYDPLIIIKYDFNPSGICKVIYTQGNCSLPIDTSKTYLRGGSNLHHYKDGYYIGCCYSRFYRVLKNWKEHYTHIILLNTNTWELVYVSKPVMFICDIKEELNAWFESESPGTKKKLDTLNSNTYILADITPHKIQAPISLYLKDNKFYLTINVRDTVSLLYEISFANLFNFIKSGKEIGYYNDFIGKTISIMI
jgi:hypothetical protein